jgi:hypothetical protein
MKPIYKILFPVTFLFSYLSAFSQQTGEPEMADLLRSNGKIYVVVAVVLIVLAGLIIFLVQIDRKVSRLEKKNQNNP